MRIAYLDHCLFSEKATRLHDEHIELNAMIRKVIEAPYVVSLAVEVGTCLMRISGGKSRIFPEVESMLATGHLTALEEQTALIQRSIKRKLL